MAPLTLLEGGMLLTCFEHSTSIITKITVRSYQATVGTLVSAEVHKHGL